MRKKKRTLRKWFEPNKIKITCKITLIEVCWLLEEEEENGLLWWITRLQKLEKVDDKSEQEMDKEQREGLEALGNKPMNVAALAHFKHSWAALDRQERKSLGLWGRLDFIALGYCSRTQRTVECRGSRMLLIALEPKPSETGDGPETPKMWSSAIQGRYEHVEFNYYWECHKTLNWKENEKGIAWWKGGAKEAAAGRRCVSWRCSKQVGRWV